MTTTTLMKNSTKVMTINSNCGHESYLMVRVTSVKVKMRLVHRPPITELAGILSDNCATCHINEGKG